MKFVTNYREFNEEKNAPSVMVNISENEIADKKIILEYMKSFEEDVVSPVRIQDIVTNKDVPITLVYYNDGEFVWDEREIYHFEKYNLKLEDEFIKKVLNT